MFVRNSLAHTIARISLSGLICLGGEGALAGTASAQSRFEHPIRGPISIPTRTPATPALPTTIDGVPNTDTSGNSWVGFRGNDQHTGYNPYQTMVTKANVATLMPKWNVFTYPAAAELTVWNGTVYGVDGGGYVRALNLATGATIWTFHDKTAGDAIYGAPAFFNGNLYVGTTGTHGDLAAVYALNARTGKVVYQWTAPSTEFSFQGPPAIANGLLYIGVSGFNEETGICDTYDNLIALSLYSPTLLSGLSLIPAANEVGADIWDAPVQDLNGNIFVGTGNSCNSTSLTYEDSVMRLQSSPSQPKMAIKWFYKSASAVPGNDMDFGSSSIFVNNMVVSGGKDGNVYAFNPTTGALIWKTHTGEVVGTPATDGTRVYVPVNFQEANGSGGACVVGSICGAFTALNLSNGSVAWSVPAHEDRASSSNFSPPAVTQNMVFTAFDQTFYAFDAATGKTLWSYKDTSGAEIWAGMSVVNGCVFGVDVGYHAFCFSPNGR
jgi:outer membrane protein assembly factor BamB